MKIAVLFPGQGSQFVGMGQEFFEQNEASANYLAEAEQASGISIRTLISEGSIESLSKSTNVQPAITAINIMLWEAIKKSLPENSVAYFAGHSLGEYSALYAAGVTDLEHTMKLVAKRGVLIEREGQANPGGMRAVLGLNIEQVEEIVGKYDGSGCVTVANFNTPQQIVISGTIDALNGIDDDLVAAEGKVIPLNVSCANHSPLVAGAVPDFTEYMSGMDFQQGNIPILFNVTAATENNSDNIKDIMAQQIASRVRWCEIISKMIDDGVDTFIEVGPKTVLKGMMRKITPKGVKVVSLQFDTPDGLQKCLEKIQA
ncbi:MAG: ACP S-malonyltransferase [Desulfotalea sp.]